MIEYEKRKGSHARETAEKAADYEHFGYPAEVFRRGTSPESEGHRRDSKNRIRYDRYRKAIRRNILNLMDCGDNIEYSESIRMVPNPKTGQPEDKTDNKQLFLTIELLDEAISRGRKVSFKYLEYGTDKRQHIKTRNDGTERVYIISPYQMAAKEGKYYLICNYGKYDDISNYRLDRITELKILDEPTKPFEHLKWANGRTLDLATYMKEHPYMYASDNVRAVFRVAKTMVSDVIDLFGTEVTFSDEDDAGVTVTAFTNEMAMEQFALNFAPDVTVLEPQRLREKVKSALEKALEKYN